LQGRPGYPGRIFALFEQPGVARSPKEGEQVRESGRLCLSVLIFAKRPLSAPMRGNLGSLS